MKYLLATLGIAAATIGFAPAAHASCADVQAAITAHNNAQSVFPNTPEGLNALAAYDQEAANLENQQASQC